MLQTYIPYIPENATFINRKIAREITDDQVVLLTATGPFYICRNDDKLGIRLAQGIIVSANLASPTELAKAIGVNQTTVSRNAKTYKDKGPAGFIDDRSDRGPYKFTTEKQTIVKRMLDTGSTILQAAEEVGISEGSVRAALRNGTIERKIIPSMPAEPKGSATRSREDVSCKKGIATKREVERVLASKGSIEEALPEFSPNESVKYAGVLLALPFLTGLGYLKIAENVYGTLKKGFYGLQSIFLTFAFMALLRIKTPEQIKNHNPGDLGIILGLDRCPEVKTLRRKLNGMSLLQLVL